MTGISSLIRPAKGLSEVNRGVDPELGSVAHEVREQTPPPVRDS